ncbi:LOB domain-containing protein 40-like protein [Tanacetum coccineum]|uniref:LOB domain-containing protein 40-like protein n=1 Tax=Tanacetum coccineum TaxID=301880 RepID=A0ABQ5FD67_9ASTR
MTMSCNGCRVLRKGCDEDCILRPCLTWITSPESQANATLFLAKFYGHAGLLNLINTGPHHLRPEIFKSLLHEACGRIINPTYGSVGLIWSGNWEQCQAAVNSVLQGSTIMQLLRNNNHDVSPQSSIMPIEGCDIRHLSKDPSNDHHRVKTLKKFKKPRCEFGSRQVVSSSVVGTEKSTKCKVPERKREELEVNQAPNHEALCTETNLLDNVGGVALLECDYRQIHCDESGKVRLDLTLG